LQVEILILIVTKINTMKKFLLLVCMIACCTAVFAQSVTLTFTAKDAANQHVQLNRVSITNLTKGWQETIYWPDTTLIMQNGTGIADVETHRGTSLQLSQNNPNPFTGTTEVSLMVAEEDEVMLDIMDINGKTVGSHRMRPQAGTHQFRITLSTAGTYVMTARQNGQTSSIKMVCNGGGDGTRIEYTGNGGDASYASATQPKSGSKYNTSHPFTFGDQMEYVGYATINGTEAESQRITHSQGASQTYTLQFPEIQHYLPTVTTKAVTSITTNSATCGGNVTSDGCTTVTARGVCWSTSQNPIVSNSHTTNGTGTGDFSSSLTGLSPNTTYYVRAYATNSVGTAYGSQMGFTTPASMPTVTSSSISNITSTTASGGGYVTSTGGATVIARGVCWSTSQNPTVSNSHTTDGTGTGSFTSSLTSLSPNTTYYVRAYATNSVGTAYGSQVSFTTPASMPTVTTNSISNIYSTTASGGGYVTSTGGATVTARGVCWSTSQNPTVSNSHTTDGTGTGSFTSNITGLTAGTTYYVRAYATNSVGTSYGAQRSFTTTDVADGNPCPGAATVTDIDGNTYNTVLLGNQCWMKENLRTMRYANGTSIPLGTSTSTITSYRYNPNNNANNVPTYGYLYNWPAVMHGASSSSSNPSGVQGICPNGWHVPSDAEWTQLTNYVSSQSQYQCGSSSSNIAKALASTTGWNSSTNNCAVGNNSSTNNATGFSALPAGDYGYGGHYAGFGYDAGFWSATGFNGRYAYLRNVNYNYADVNGNGNGDVRYCGYSVRCVRD
jgi:uncharacterized protein (TIGR02145 family)